MSRWLRSRNVRQHREAAAGEIAQLTASVARLFPGRAVPLRVRLALRIHARTERPATIVMLTSGLILGIWWPLPIAMLLDSRRGSIRDVIASFHDGFRQAIISIDDPAKAIESVVRMGTMLALFLILWGIIAFAPIITCIRIGRGYPGIRLPGRNLTLLNRTSSIVYSCALALTACGEALGKSGERRVREVHAAADRMRQVRRRLPMLANSESSPKGIRRKRRRLALQHARHVSTVLKNLEGRLAEAPDEEIKKTSEILFKIADRAANHRYTELLDADQLPMESPSDRESVRLAAGAALTLTLSAASIAVLNFLGLASGLEPVAITASLIVSAVIVFRGNALQKLESLGLFGGGRTPGGSESDRETS